MTTGNNHKRVFISYRRESGKWQARCVANFLRNNGYDVFLDVDTIQAGRFDKIIVNELKSRIHFVLILSKGSLDRCVNPHDWLKREITTAIQQKRNIVPLFFDEFSMSASEDFLKGELNQLSTYNGLKVSHELFDKTMERLRDSFLDRLDLRYLEKASLEWTKNNLQSAMEFVSEALEINPEFAEGFNRRGSIYAKRGQVDLAIADFVQAVEFNESFSDAHYNLALAYSRYYEKTQDLSYNALAFRQYEKVLELDPNYISAYLNRGNLFFKLGKLESAKEDYSSLIEISRDYELAYLHRAYVYEDLGQPEKAIADYTSYLKYTENVEDASTKLAKLRLEILIKRSSNP